MARLLNSLKGGESKLSVSHYSFGQELEYVEVSLEEARELVHKTMAKGHSWRLSSSQFAFDDAGNDVDPHREEVNEVYRFLGLVPFSDIEV